jgi:secretion/DNA translocation related TadE-like protein
LNNDSGGISILMLSLSLAALSLFSFIGFALNVFLLANQINNVADRVALGAATNLISAPDDTCVVAEQIATANNSKLVTCEVLDDELTIKVRSDSQFQTWLDYWPHVGMARAGIDYIFD